MMPASRTSRRVTAENLARLGAERLAAILESVADSRPDLKRRLRMELAAEQGAGPLASEIDRRLASYETSKGRVGWRQKPALIRDLDALRLLIAERLAPLDAAAGAERLWRYMDFARQAGSRLREREDLDPVFARAAGDLGALASQLDQSFFAHRLAEALAAQPSGWTGWLPSLLAAAPDQVATLTLDIIPPQTSKPGWQTLVRDLARAARDAEAFQATFSAQALTTPSVAAEVAQQHLAAGDVERAGEVLQAAAPKAKRFGKTPPPDPAWEGAWIDYLDASGDKAAAQDARWAAFERTLSIERARAFIGRLDDFDDVEAEQRAFAIAARHEDFATALRFLMDWPSLGDAARMIEARAEEAAVDAGEAELWAAKLRRRYPGAANTLLRKSAAAAFRRRDYTASDRLTQEADSIGA